ncbi:iron complex transport system substrate-binding protein [Desulfocicer vacuolatum DSM 3385]|uniref:Iron complex transport system substrate-binding protein n=2 Tax=Desulfocicer vacuolatum TaxID=2298 RepID=A0A1W2DDC0_9BACT|nr:iron complex transport system substrate-binding protein [Desulfocicer vacuolatum DSM 3385]
MKCKAFLRFIRNTPQTKGVFQALLWAEPDQNTVCPWQLYKYRLNSKILLFLMMGFFVMARGDTGCCAGNRQIVGEDDFGRKIVLEKPPERIVLLSGTPVDLIYELGAGHMLVGVVDTIATSYPETCRRYPSILEKEGVGRFSAPNIEKIVSLAPDLIIPFASSESPGKYTTVFERRGLAYAAFVSVENVAFGIEQIKRMGSVLGKEKEGKALAHKIRTEVDTLSKKISSRIKDRPLVYYWWGTRNGTYGARTAINELIELAGGVNLAGQFDAQHMELSPEYVIARDPDVIVISYWKESQRDERVAALRKKPGFSGVKAVKNNRVHTIEGHSFHTTIRFAEVIQTLAEFIHPGVLGDSGYSGGLRP